MHPSPCSTLALVIAGGPCALLAACALRSGARADVFVVEAPCRATVHLLPTRALARLPPEAADALHAHGAATPDGGALCVEAAKLRSVLLSCIPSAARLEGRVTGFSQEAAGVHVRLEGRAGRRSQRKVHCAALVGAGGASCAVRAALLGAAPAGKLALWRGVSTHAGDTWQQGPTFARDAGGACVGAAVTLGDRIHWCLLAPPQPPRAVNGEAAREALAAAAAPWPSLAAAVASTPSAALSCEPFPEPRGCPLRAQGSVLLMGQAARGAASAAMDDLADTYADCSVLMHALAEYTPGDMVSAAAAYAAAAFHD